ncbi:MAG: hypothetical protein LH702_11640 [Phormidesmis sp. CAN_BIN44]|nr:hypothetical protein [Phormidesmis sp. CAN_BIN44]
MKKELIRFAISASLGVGFGFGFSLVLSGKPFTLEATNTPIGSFVLHGNVANSETLLIPDQERLDSWSDIA